LLLTTTNLPAQEDRAAFTAQYGDRPKNAARVSQIDRANLSRYKDTADVLVLPGLIARRNEQRVEILAEATGLARGTVVEFLLIDSTSGKGYESLLWSFARPSDVHKALIFIGMKPGEPFNAAGLRFWPKGERVLLSVAAKSPSSNDSPPRRLETLVMDKRQKTTLPKVGFVFTGSFMVNKPGENSRRAYAADVVTPKSIASLYNDPTTVLDVPRRARQSDVYGSLVVGPGYDFAKNELLTINLAPEHKNGRQRVKDLVLEVRQVARKAVMETDSAPPVEFLLKDKTEKMLTERPALPAVLGKLDSLIKSGHDPYVSIRFGDALPLGHVQKVCRVAALIDTDSGIRVEPPEPGQLYYRAFLPDNEYLDRENRIIQPWELRLVDREGKISGTLTLYESVFRSDRSAPEMKTTTFEIDAPRSIRRRLDADAARRKEAGRRAGPPVLLVFGDKNLTYGKLLEFLEPALTTHNAIHVFFDPQAHRATKDIP